LTKVLLKGWPSRDSGTTDASQPRRASGEAGFVGGFEGLLFGLLLFVAGTLLIGYAWAIVDTKSATQEAARQAARTYVQAPSAAQAASSAQQAAAASLAGYGRDPARAAVALVAGSFARCQRITISVSYPAPLLLLPFIGRVGSGTTVRAEHSELVDPYRTSLPGTAACL
jgi:cytochrome bd-type quinol oxidase subunit 2